VKAFAAVLIILSCGSMGVIAAGSYAQRVHHLRELLRFLHLLESEIQFSRTTLPKFLAGQAPLFSGVVGRFLAVLRQGLEEGQGDSFQAIWEQGLALLADNGLPSAALEDLRACGAALGRSDAAEQCKHIQRALFRLEQALAAAEEERSRYQRLWQYLGFCTGLLLVLLLI